MPGRALVALAMKQGEPQTHLMGNLLNPLYTSTSAEEEGPGTPRTPLPLPAAPWMQGTCDLLANLANKAPSKLADYSRLRAEGYTDAAILEWWGSGDRGPKEGSPPPSKTSVDRSKTCITMRRFNLSIYFLFGLTPRPPLLESVRG